MALSSTALADALQNLGEPSSPATAADAWFEAWWKYASQMSFFTDLTLGSAKIAAKPLFVAALLVALTPSSAATPFLTAWEAAQRAVWGALGSVAFLPTYSLCTPAPSPLAGLLEQVRGVGLGAKERDVPAKLFASITDTWTQLFTATPVAPPNTPVLFV